MSFHFSIIQNVSAELAINQSEIAILNVIRIVLSLDCFEAPWEDTNESFMVAVIFMQAKVLIIEDLLAT
jgi:hypothetical protein